MAQTGFTPISIYYSSTASNVPTAGNLVAGELAINTADGRLYYKDSAGVVQVIGTKGGVGTSTTTQVLYNSSGLIVGSANMTFNGTTFTLANDASISGLTVGKGGGSLSTNTAVGNNALAATNSGGYSVAVGQNAGAANTSGQITAVGSSALYTNTTGTNNTAIGISGLYSNTTGGSNSSLGHQALFNNTTASNNTAVGYQASYTSTTATELVAIGKQALYANTGSYNTAVGNIALSANTTGEQNTAVGRIALASNTTGGNNSAFGSNCMYLNTTGTNNSAFGQAALFSNTTSSFNSAFGVGCLSANTTGGNNTAQGYQALASNTTASNNTAVGYQAGYAVTTGGYNLFLGDGAGSGCTTGQQNIYIGHVVASTHTTGSSCIYMSAQGAIASSSSVQNEMIIATQNPTGKGANTGFISPNGGGVYQGNNSTLWSVTSDARLKKNIVDNNTGLDKITAIQVRNFEYRLPEEVTEVSPDQAIQKTGVQLGAIAQELQQILPECVKQESTGIYTVDASNLTWYLINAVKELKAEIDLLKGK